MSVRKNEEEVVKLRVAGKLLAQCLDMLVKEARQGVSGLYLDGLAEQFIRDHGALPAFKGYAPGGKAFPASICFSRNYVLVHGVPQAEDRIEDGDLITIDCGLSLDGWFADAARIFGVGDVPAEDQKMIAAAKKVLNAGIGACKVGNTLGDVCHAIQLAIVDSGFFNVYQFCGHAIGREMHEEPQVPNFGRPKEGLPLEAGMVFCLEPMLLKHRAVRLGVLETDGWTVITSDLSRAAHIEHMVLITEGEPEVLTAEIF